MKFLFAVLALAAGASAINVGLGWGGADVAIARAAHLAEVNRVTGERLGALNAALVRDATLGQVVVGGGLRGVGLGGLGQVVVGGGLRGVAVGGLGGLNLGLGVVNNGLGWGHSPVPPQDNLDVAVAKAAHIAEHNRQTGNALVATANANARNVGLGLLLAGNGLGWSG